MRRRNLWLAGCLVVAALAAPSSLAAQGKNVLHLTLRTGFEPSADLGNPDPGAEGSLDLKLRQQGHADVQKLRLEVGHLTPTTEYTLWVLRDAMEDEVQRFVTDAKGEASLKLMHLGHGNNPAKKFHDALDPLTDVLTLQVRTADGTVVVLGADLSDPDWLQYLVKRQLDSEVPGSNAEGTLFLKEHGSKVLFRLRAANLDVDPSADYTLAINCTDVATLTCAYVETFTADAEGRLDIKGLPGTPPAPFDMTDLALVDAGNQVVLSTDLP